MISTRNAWIRKEPSFKPGFTIGEKLIKATNHLGYEVQEYDKDKGWISAIEEQVGFEADGDTAIYKPLIVPTKALAEDLMEGLKDLTGSLKRELRVYEVVEFPVKKA